MDIDCVFLTLAVGRNTYFVASEHITRKKFVYSLIKRFFKVILYTKGGNGVETVKSVLSVIKNGENVILFPEGNRSFNGSTCYIDPSVAKLVKISNADLITYKLNGAYFASPRWSDKTYSNGIKGELSGYYSSSDIKGMTLDSVYDSIVKDLNYNDYQTNQGKRIRLSATGLESMLFVCPKCHSKSSLTSNKKGIFCSCGYNLKMSNGYLFDSIGNSYSIFDLDEIDKTELKTMIKDNDRLFSDEVLVSYINRKR